MSDFVIGLIRTYVPIVVGVLLSWLVSLGLNLDPSVQAGLISALTGILTAVYYTAVRFLAEKWPGAGILLGVNKAPAYNEG
jgi:hypothetical protein